MTDLSSKVAVITGAANGLGKALATELYRQGCHLALIDIDFNGLRQLKDELQNNWQQITLHNADISNEQDVTTAREQIIFQHHRIDILINNAGISISQPFDQIDISDYKELFGVNFWGTIYCTKHFLQDLKEQRDSRLINIISDFALMGFPCKTAYGSSKSAVLGFTNSLKTELAGTNVKICLVIPPPLNTALVRNGKHINDSKKHNEVKFLEKTSMPLNQAAQLIVRQIRKGKYRIVIGKMMFFVDLVSRLFPTAVHNLIGKNKKRFDFV
jgi:short-subunit dehydrogenase